MLGTTYSQTGQNWWAIIAIFIGLCTFIPFYSLLNRLSLIWFVFHWFSSDTSEPPVPVKEVKPVTKGQFLLIELPDRNATQSRCSCCCASNCCYDPLNCCCTGCWSLFKMIVGEYFKRIVSYNLIITRAGDRQPHESVNLYKDSTKETPFRFTYYARSDGYIEPYLKFLNPCNYRWMIFVIEHDD